VVIAGHASGESRIAIHNAGGTGGLTGTDPTDGIQVVEIGGRSDAEFKLSHAVIAGIYDYNLYQADGQNWYLQSKANKDEEGGPGEGKVADSIEGYNLALSAAQQHVQATLGSFHERLGELRSQPEQTGYQSWFRGIGQGGSYAPRASGHAGRAFDLNTSGFQLGADYGLSGLAGPGDQLTFGAFGDRARSRLDVKRSTANGTLTSKGVGVYAAYQQQAPAGSAPGAGFYADAVLKHDWLDLEVKAVSVSQFGIGHAYTGSAFTAALETGYGLGVGNGVVVVPNAQLSWSKLDADGFIDDTGVSVHSQHAKSLLGRAGVRLEKTLFLGQGAASYHHKTLAKSVTTFADISAKHEFKGNNGLVANDTALGSNMGGTRGDIGLGAVARISPRVSLFGRAAAEFGGNTTEVSKKASAGIKVAW
jgi:outer membrane autotransporter protein